MRGSGGLARARATSLTLRGGNSFWTTAADYDGDGEEDDGNGDEKGNERELMEQPAARQRALLLRQVNETVIRAVGAVWLLLAEEYTRALQSKVTTITPTHPLTSQTVPEYFINTYPKMLSYYPTDTFYPYLPSPLQHWDRFAPGPVFSTSTVSLSVASMSTDLESDDGETSLGHAPVPVPASTPASKALSRTASSFRSSSSMQTPSKSDHGGGVRMDHEMLANLRFLLACANDGYRVSTVHVDAIVCMERSLDAQSHTHPSGVSGGGVAHEVARSVADAFQAVTEAALKSVVRVVFAPLVHPVLLDFETQWTEVSPQARSLV